MLCFDKQRVRTWKAQEKRKETQAQLPDTRGRSLHGPAVLHWAVFVSDSGSPCCKQNNPNKREGGRDEGGGEAALLLTHFQCCVIRSFTPQHFHFILHYALRDLKWLVTSSSSVSRHFPSDTMVNNAQFKHVMKEKRVLKVFYQKALWSDVQ